MTLAKTDSSTVRWSNAQRVLAGLLCLAPLVQALALLTIHSALRSSTFALTGLVPVIAACCGFWRASKLRHGEGIPWLWSGISLLLWATGTFVDGLTANSAAHTIYDPAGFFYLAAGFPLMLSFTRTRRSATVKPILFLTTIQLGLAFVLIWLRPVRTLELTNNSGASLFNIYTLECLLLAAFAILRLFTCATYEERRHMLLINIALWLYLPVEFGIDYSVLHFNLPPMGSFADLLWSIPFLAAGWLTLRSPIVQDLQHQSKARKRHRLLETISPMIMTVGIFAMAASMILQHTMVAFIVIVILLVLQGTESALVQLNYIITQEQLLVQGEKLLTANAALERLTFLDPLTGIANRRHFDQALESIWRQSVRRGDTLSVLMIDLDFFKAVNDMHGHAYGDECLKRVAQVLARQAHRPTDLLARYGGDELILLLPETDSVGAAAVARRMQKAVAESNLVNQASPFGQRVTISIGIGICKPVREISSSLVLQLADEALYESKRLGRNIYSFRMQNEVAIESLEV